MSFQKELLRLIRAYAVIFITSGWKGGKKIFSFFFSITCSQRVIQVNLENWFFRAIVSQGQGVCLWAMLLEAAVVVCGLTSGDCRGLQPPATPPSFGQAAARLSGGVFPAGSVLFLSTRFFFVKAVELFLPSSFSSVGTSAVLRVNIAVFNSVLFLWRAQSTRVLFGNLQTQENRSQMRETRYRVM